MEEDKEISDEKILSDYLNELLDELSVLSPLWQKYRENGKTPKGIGSGMIIVVCKIAEIIKIEINCHTEEKAAGEEDNKE